MKCLFIIFCALALASCGSDGAQGEQGEAGSQGPKGNPGPIADISTYDFVNGECQLIEGVYVKRNVSVLELYAQSSFDCVGTAFARLDTDDEIYWVTPTRLFMLNTSARLFVLEF